MRRATTLVLCLLMTLAVAGPATGQVNLAALKAKLDSFQDNVRFALKLIDKSRLQLTPGERVEDLVAFGFANTVIKANFPAAFSPRAAAEVLAAKRDPKLEANLKENLLGQIAAACGSPGPKPTNDKSVLMKIRTLMVPDFYNKTLILIASGAQFATFGTIRLETPLELGKAFYFPVLEDSFAAAFAKLPRETQALLRGYFLR